MKINSSHSAVIYTPGRWTGNNIFFKGGLIIEPGIELNHLEPFRARQLIIIRIRIIWAMRLFCIYYPPEVSSMKYCCLGVIGKEYFRLATT